MTIQENIPLAKYTTFKIGGPARFFCQITNEDELAEAVRFAHDNNVSFLVLGGGSNILICDDGYPGLVIKNELKGIEVSGNGTENGIGGYDESYDNESGEDSILISSMAGESWDGFVAYTVSEGLYGLENLSAIPGTVGAAPVQNIGAYGTDASQCIHSVRAFDTKAMKLVTLSKKDCAFGYRDSIFKTYRGRYIITQVTFKLSRRGVLKTDYKDVTEYLTLKKISNPTLEQLRLAIVEIRAGKLPDWTKWGTAGSFFKNPIITAKKFEELKFRYPDLPGFPEPNGKVKVSLGWILDKICNAKGLTVGNVGTYDKQALVIVAKPGAKSKEVMVLVQTLMKKVREKTGIDIEGEVEWVC